MTVRTKFRPGDVVRLTRSLRLHSYRERLAREIRDGLASLAALNLFHIKRSEDREALDRLLSLTRELDQFDLTICKPGITLAIASVSDCGVWTQVGGGGDWVLTRELEAAATLEPTAEGRVG